MWRKPTRDQFEPVPTKIRDVVYPSQAAAARALGLAHSTIRDAMDEGRLDTVGMAKRGVHLSIPITINGVRYRSLSYAATYVGMCRSSIWKAKSRLGDNLNYIDGKWSKANG